MVGESLFLVLELHMDLPSKEAKIIHLLRVAEKSLSKQLARDPQRRHAYLSELFAYINEHSAELAANGDKDGRFPEARGLSWDLPTTDAESQCLDDAYDLFRFIRRECGGEPGNG